MATPIKGKSDIQNVATISANNDPEIGKIMADAFDKVGKDGVITVEEGKSAGHRGDGGRGHAVRPRLPVAELRDRSGRDGGELRSASCSSTRTRSTASKLVPLLEKVMQGQEAAAHHRRGRQGEALATLVVNKLRGTLQVCAVKAPGYGDRRKAMLQDIAVLTGASRS
jgi:chaperonin GroEL